MIRTMSSSDSSLASSLASSLGASAAAAPPAAAAGAAPPAAAPPDGIEANLEEPSAISWGVRQHIMVSSSILLEPFQPQR
jgi:hypothetical protein